MKFVFLQCIFLCCAHEHHKFSDKTVEKTWPIEEEKTEFWRKVGSDQIKQALHKPRIEQQAQNVILFVGDGMGIQTITAGRYLMGGENYVTAMESLDFAGLLKTYSIDLQTPDSASTGTAYMTGVKTRGGMLGINGKAAFGDKCENMESVKSTMEMALESGKSVGFVTTTYVSHASPAAAFAKTTNRGWYSDASMMENGEIPAELKGCKDIAKQLFEKSSNFTVILGGGRRHFYASDYSDGRVDGQDFIEKWKNDKNVEYLETKSELDNYYKSKMNKERLVGIFAEGHMAYEVDRAEHNPNEPDLALMTKVAIKKLSKNPNGYYLFVEGGNIDHGHHETAPVRALYDFKIFDEAIAESKEGTDFEKTLLIVTADHSHTFSIGAFGRRGDSIFGLGSSTSTQDSEGVFILGYANGRGFDIQPAEVDNELSCVRRKPSEIEDIWTNPEQHSDYTWPSAQKTVLESHGADDVAVMAQGPFAHLFSGVYEQVHVAHVAEYALCLGDYKTAPHCPYNDPENPAESSTLEMFSFFHFMTFLTLSSI